MGLCLLHGGRIPGPFVGAGGGVYTFPFHLKVPIKSVDRSGFFIYLLNYSCLHYHRNLLSVPSTLVSLQTKRISLTSIVELYTEIQQKDLGSESGLLKRPYLWSLFPFDFRLKTGSKKHLKKDSRISLGVGTRSRL